jgi:hypothetical protein
LLLLLSLLLFFGENIRGRLERGDVIIVFVICLLGLWNNHSCLDEEEEVVVAWWWWW